MVVKELRQGLNSRGFILSFVALHTLLGLVIILQVFLFSQGDSASDAALMSFIFWVPVGALLILVTPLRALNELAAERKANTLELIFMSGLSAWRIALGKWTSLLIQALLFVVAALPYFILRYFFGSVDLARELTALARLVLDCAALSAIALAISGLPTLGRIVAACIATLFMLRAVPLMSMFSLAVGGGTASFGTAGAAPRVAGPWLITWNATLISIIGLQVAAATFAPRAENHASLPRVCALLLCAPLPLLRWLQVDEWMVASQLFTFAMVCGIVGWMHLATPPAPFQSYCRPFRGWRVLFGIPLQPGWPSAVVFIVLAVLVSGLVALAAGPPPGTPTMRFVSEFSATSAMAGAALLSATLFSLIVPRVRHPFIVQLLFLVLCAVLMVMLSASSSSDLSSDLSQTYGLSIVPPLAFMGMANSDRDGTWTIFALVSLLAYATILFISAGPYWHGYFKHCRDLARTSPEPAATLLS